MRWILLTLVAGIVLWLVGKILADTVFGPDMVSEQLGLHYKQAPHPGDLAGFSYAKFMEIEFYDNKKLPCCGSLDFYEVAVHENNTAQIIECPNCKAQFAVSLSRPEVRYIQQVRGFYYANR
jgi:hypothetical protein